MLIGFNTGSFYKFIQPISKEAIDICKEVGCNAIELGGGTPKRIFLLKKINTQDLKSFDYVSLHAPGEIKYKNDVQTKKILDAIQEADDRFNFKCVVLHPDLVEDWSIFNNYNFKLAIENNDNTRLLYKSFNSIKPLFSNKLIKRLILDLNHCYTNDKTMDLAGKMYSKFKNKICELHISGYINKKENHEPLYITKQKEIINSIPNKSLPIIIESVCLNKDIARYEIKYLKEKIK